MAVAHTHPHDSLPAQTPGGGLAPRSRFPGDRTFRFIGLALLLSTVLLAGLYASSLPAGLPLARLSLIAGRSGADDGSQTIQVITGGGAAATAASKAAAPAAAHAGKPQRQVEQQDDKKAKRKHTQTQASEQREQRQHGQLAEEGQVDGDDQLLPAAYWQEGTAYTTPESRCTIHPDGSVSHDPSPAPDTGMPFLFDLAQFATKQYRERMCGRGIDNSWRGRWHCFGPCIFEMRLCAQQYPGEGRAEAMVQRYQAAGWSFGDLSPCELFQRIRGRTLWWMGDSQTCHFYYAAECFLREFAPRMNRTAPFPKDINARFNTHDPPIYPKCFQLAHNTRVCQLRVDMGRDMIWHVFPLMLKHNPSFANDIVLFNFGLHYGSVGDEGFLTDISKVIRWRAKQQKKAGGPRLVWMDVPLQHFDTPDGRFNKKLLKGSKKNMTCRNLTAWYEGVPGIVQGGLKNVLARPHVHKMADAHLRTWNASAPLWDVHMPGECTHYCSPTAYHVWLYLLNKELGTSGVGHRVQVRDKAAAATAKGSAAAAAAAASVAGQGSAVAAAGGRAASKEGKAAPRREAGEGGAAEVAQVQGG